MPLKHGKSEKAFKANVETEMKSGKPQDQSLAIAYSIKRKGKKPKKMAEGGMAYKNDSAKTESRPIPEEMDNDAKMARQNSGKKPASQDHVLDQPTVAQARKNDSRNPLPIKHPKMVPISGASVRMRDQEDHLQEAAKVNNGHQEQPPKADDEEGANRQGPKVAALEMKKMAKGGKYANGGAVSFNEAEEDHAEHPAGLESDNDEMAPPESEFMAGHFAEGGLAHDEVEDELHDSIAAAIMARRDRKAAGGSVASGSEDMNYADGGEILSGSRKSEIKSHGSMDSDDSDQADLSRNADEDANEEDQSSFDSLRKENYSESASLEKLDAPMDSGQHGHDLSDEDAHDMVASIRRKMAQRRQFGK